ncbi:MAG: GNAT family N-acetyltransferase [Candidatus Hodarchaeota archaeon]
MESKEKINKIQIRRYQKSDRNSIINICHTTGYMGDDASAYFYDRKLFALLYALCYTDYEPKNCFVAEVNGKVVGYIIGTRSTSHQKWNFRLRISWKIVLRLIIYTSWRYPHDIKTIFQILTQGLRRKDVSFSHSSFEGLKEEEDPQKDKWQKERFQAIIESFSLLASSFSEKEINQQYPAHLHINILKEYQGVGLGGQLLRTFENHLRNYDVVGYHLHTTDHNYKAIPFYLRYALKLLAVKKTSFSWPNTSLVQNLTFGKNLKEESDPISQISKEKALDLIQNSSKSSHSILVSKVMCSVARYLDEDKGKEIEWELGGLLHDLDYDLTTNARHKHGIITAELLKGQLPDIVLEAIKSHDHRTGLKPQTKLSKALRSADALVVFLDMMREEGGLFDVETFKQKLETDLSSRPWLKDLIYSCGEFDLPLKDFLKIGMELENESGVPFKKKNKV